MKISNLLFTSFLALSIVSGCTQPALTTYRPAPVSTSDIKTFNYKNKFSPAVLNILSSPDNSALPGDEPLKEGDFTVEYGKHTLFFTSIDKTGSAVEEILDHDGYIDSARYLVHWRGLIGENVDWPDHFSTT